MSEFNVFYEMWANDPHEDLVELNQALTGNHVSDVSLAFAMWRKDGDGNFNIFTGYKKGTKKPVNEWLSAPKHGGKRIDPYYYAWTYAKHKNPQTNFLISFGGWNFADIWNQLASISTECSSPNKFQLT